MSETNQAIYCHECGADFNVLHDMDSRSFIVTFCPFCQAEIVSDDVEDWNDEDENCE